MISPAVFKLLDTVFLPLADPYNRQVRTQNFQDRYDLDQYSQSQKPARREVARTALLAVDRMKERGPEQLCSKALRAQVAACLNAGLPPGPAATALATVGAQAYQVTRNKLGGGYEHSLRMAIDVADTFNQAVERVSDNPAVKAMAEFPENICAVVHDPGNRCQIGAAALRMCALDPQWSASQASAWLAREIMNDPNITFGDTRFVALGSLLHLAEQGESQEVRQLAGAALKSYVAREDQCKRDQQSEPGEQIHSPAKTRFEYDNLEQFQAQLGAIFDAAGTSPRPESSPRPQETAYWGERESDTVVSELLQKYRGL